MCQSALMMHPQKIDFAESVLAKDYNPSLTLDAFYLGHPRLSLN
jgi:hypothetical protein